MIPVNGRLQIRHSSGNRTEKSPCGIFEAKEAIASGKPTRGLEKAHPPAMLAAMASQTYALVAEDT